MAKSQAFSRQATNGSKYEYGCYGTNNDHEASLNQEADAKALSAQRLEDFFANEHAKSSSPSSWGRASISSTTKNMQAQLQAFDQAFHVNDIKHTSRK